MERLPDDLTLFEILPKLDKYSTIFLSWSSPRLHALTLRSSSPRALLDPDLLIWAASNGHVEILKLMHFKFNLPISPQAWICAARRGQLSALTWAHERGLLSAGSTVAQSAREAGYHDIVKKLIEWEYVNDDEPELSTQLVEQAKTDYEVRRRVLRTAFATGQLGVLETLLHVSSDSGEEFEAHHFDDTLSLFRAIENGHVQVLEFILQISGNAFQWNFPEALRRAKPQQAVDPLELTEWLLKVPSISENVFSTWNVYVTSSGSLSALQLSVAKHPTVPLSPCLRAAISANQIEIVKYLLFETSTPFLIEEHLSRCAHPSVSLDLLHIPLAFPISALDDVSSTDMFSIITLFSVLRAFISSGTAPQLALVLSYCPPLDSLAESGLLAGLAQAAVREADLEKVQHLAKQGVPFDGADLATLALETNSLDMVQFVLDHGAPMPDWSGVDKATSLIRSLASRAAWRTCRYLIERGSTPPPLHCHSPARCPPCSKSASHC